MPPVTPPEAEALDRKLDTLLPRVRITELLLEVAERTGFLNAFRDLRSGKEHENPSTVLAAILADGDRKSTRRPPVTNAHLVCRFRLAKQKDTQLTNLIYGLFEITTTHYSTLMNKYK